MKWNEIEIRKVLNKLDEKTGLNSKDIPIRISNRMIRSKGSFTFSVLYKDHVATLNTQKLLFTFASILLDGRFDDKTVIDVIEHEYIHYYCAYHKPNCRTGHGPFFKESCIKYGVNPETYFTAKPNITDDIEKVNVYVVKCTNCGTEHYHKTKTKVIKDINRYRCGTCRGRLTYTRGKRVLY